MKMVNIMFGMLLKLFLKPLSQHLCPWLPWPKKWFIHSYLAWILARGKITNKYTDGRHTSGVTMALGYYWNNKAFFTSRRGKIVNVLQVHKLLDIMLLPVTLASNRVPRHSKLDFRNLREMNLLTFSPKMMLLKRSNTKPLSNR